MNPKNFPDGWWTASLLDPNDPEAGWLLRRSDAAHGHWHFVVVSRSDSTIHKGSLSEHYGESPERTTFRWYPAEGRLVIDRSDLCPDGFVFACYEEAYRVERVDENTLKLPPDCE